MKKTTRELRELRVSLAPTISGSRFAVKFDYIPVILTFLIKRLCKNTDDSIDEVITFLDNYHLTPTHLKEHLNDLQYPKRDYYGEVSSNIKSKLTRLFNLRFSDDSKKIHSTKHKSTAKGAPEG